MMKNLKNLYILLVTILMAMPSVSKAYIYDENGFMYIEHDDLTAAVYNCPDDVDTLRIPSHVTYNGLTYTVTSIRYIVNPYPSNGIRADDVVHISMPNTIKTIEDNAFENLYSLRSVDMSNSLTSIGDSAFRSCSLESINIPGTVTSIGRSAFASCWHLTHMDLSNTSISKIEEDTFWGCMNLESIDLPSSVTTIGRNAFAASRLKHIELPEGVTTIGYGAFSDCDSLKSVTLPESLATIMGWAFGYCTALQEMFIPRGVNSISPDFIIQCNSIKSLSVDSDNPTYDSRKNCNAIIRTADNTLIQGSPVTIIPGSVTAVGDWAFWGIDIPADFIIPNSIRTIEDNAFRGFSKMTNLILPESVEWIGESSFESCRSLTSLTLHALLTHIGDKAFYGCQELRNVKVFHTEPLAIDENVFENKAYQNGTLHVPHGCEDNYKAANGWKRFSRIIGDLVIDTPLDVNSDGEIDIADANSVIEIIINGGNSGHTRAPDDDGEIAMGQVTGDVNGDGEVNIADFNAVIDRILSGQ